MSWLTDPSPTDFERWEKLLRDGIEPAAAARQVGTSAQHPEGRGYTCSAFRRANPVRHGELLELSREVRGYVTDKIVENDVCDRDQDGVPVAFKDSASDAMKQFYARRHQPAYAQTQVQIAGELEVTSTDVADALERLNTLVAAAAVRAAARDGQELVPGQPERAGSEGARLAVARLAGTP